MDNKLVITNKKPYEDPKYVHDDSKILNTEPNDVDEAVFKVEKEK